ncbi:MAG TPA: long-chain fatty acid--CoA ligase [Pseudonocardia sp.]|jgi:long-chain acyl-CoA synthetase|nr:long-chain fatty acid--CoA ligase [Pseudonocardia sp.]
MIAAGTLLELVERNAAEYADLPATVDGPEQLTWSRYRERARSVALALIDLGVRPGQVVGLHMANRAEHVVSDVGALYAGTTPTTFYNTLSAEQLTYVARDSAAAVAIVDPAHLPLWLSIRDQLPELKHLVVLDTASPGEGVLSFEGLVRSAEGALAQRGSEVDQAAATVRPEHSLTIVYTSGTTGHPKGTIVTHAGVRFVMAAMTEQTTTYDRPLPSAGSAVLSYLPLAHIAERSFSHYMAIYEAYTVTYVRDFNAMASMLPKVRPHVFLGVPRIWEKIYGTIRERGATERSPVKRRLASTAVEVAIAWGRASIEGTAPDPRTRLLHPIMQRLVYTRIRAALGLDRVQYALSGAAPLSGEILSFFAGIGINLVEAYGMTETSAVLTITPPGAPRLGTVGTALPGIELRIADDGEVLARGPNITPGYLNRPDADAETFDAQGWLHTGDLGRLDSDGYLSITGRKKELIINAAGKNISPANIELVISGQSDLIGPVYVHGDQRPYLVALVTLDPLGWEQWCDARGITASTIAEAVADPRVREEVGKAVEAGNARLARVEQIKRWQLVDHLWNSESGELTPTMKLKRPVIKDRYQGELETLYSAS